MQFDSSFVVSVNSSLYAPPGVGKIQTGYLRGLTGLIRKLGCKITPKAKVNAIAFPVDMLDLPVATSNRMLFGLLGNYLDQLRALSKSNLIEQVEACVRNSLSTGHFILNDCAKQLAVSTRTLQRRLAQHGIKFSSIVQDERIRLAKHALSWSDYTLDEIAFRLGYAEQTSFGRAFKQATGMTPRAFRSREKRRHLPVSRDNGEASKQLTSPARSPMTGG